MKTLLTEDAPDPCPGSSWGRLPRLIPFPHIRAQSARAEEISLKRLGGNSLRNQGRCVPAWGAGGRDPRALIEAIGRDPRALTQGGCGQPPPPPSSFCGSGTSRTLVGGRGSSCYTRFCPGSTGPMGTGPPPRRLPTAVSSSEGVGRGGGRSALQPPASEWSLNLEAFQPQSNATADTGVAALSPHPEGQHAGARTAPGPC